MKPWLWGAGLVAATATAGAVALWKMFAMPGEVTDETPRPVCEDHETLVRDLQETVEALASDFGERHLHGREAALDRTVRYLEDRLKLHGLSPRRQTYVVDHQEVHNIVVEFKGLLRPRDVVVVGAHYDSAMGTPGANDNASGVAATLALACRMASRARPPSTVRFVFFVNEEPPYFQTDYMGSHVYAAAAAERGDDIQAMMAIETIGYYSDRSGSQHYPEGIGAGFPDVGNFVAFVGNLKSSALVKRSIKLFRDHGGFPSQGVALPEKVPGVGWSDHWSFWRHGYRAFMVTDTAPYRYEHYHTREDTPDKLNYERMAQVVDGLDAVVRGLSGE